MLLQDRRHQRHRSGICRRLQRTSLHGLDDGLPLDCHQQYSLDTPTTPSGAGNGLASYAFEANPSVNPRSAFITIAGQPLMVTQAGASCSYQLSPAKRAVGPQNTTGSITVNAPVGCAWTAKSMADWITIASGTNGSGTGTVTYAVAVNPGPAREGMIAVADQTFVMDQAAPAGQADLSVTISPS